MKSYLFKVNLSLLLILVASFSFGQSSDDIKFEKGTQKFMRVEEGHQITLTYSFSYLGTWPLKIIPPDVDCSCTKVILPEGEIQPNSTNSIKIKFDTNGKIGYQERAVVLKFVSDAMDSKFIEKKLTFKGMVVASKETKRIYKENKKKK